VKPAEARRLFDDNAATYDRVNSVVSLGLDTRWREWAARRAVVRPGARVLDAFAGTGRVGLRAAELGASVTLTDVSPGMLAIGLQRAADRSLDVTAVVADLTASSLPVDDRFDAVTVMWGLRYLDDPAGVLARLATHVVPGGRIVVVDFIEPAGGAISCLAASYFFGGLPLIAGTLAGRRDLYRELVATTHAMGSREHLLAIVGDAGLEVVEERLMGFGLVLGVVAVARSY